MNTTPRQLQEALNKVSEESYALHQELAEIVERSADTKLELLKVCNSGKEVETRYAATADGKREAFLKVYLRGLSHKRTALLEESKANRGGF